MNILKFPFPTPPNLNHIRDAIVSLVKLKALQLNILEENEDQSIFETVQRSVKDNKDETVLTELGKILVYIPLHPKFAKMLLEARKVNCLGYMLLIVCALSVDELCRNEKIIEENEEKTTKPQRDEEDDEEIVFFNLKKIKKRFMYRILSKVALNCLKSKRK